jgi:L-lactate utilization protein LutC
MMFLRWENRWKYLTNKWKTDLGGYGLPQCLHLYKIEKEADNTILDYKFDQQTEYFKEVFQHLLGECMESSHDSLKRKIEEQAEEMTSLKKKLNKMHNKLDEVLKLLSR